MRMRATNRGDLRNVIALTLLSFLFGAVPDAAWAEVDAGEDAKSEFTWQKGPVAAQLGSAATVQVPEGFAFVDAAGAQALLQSMGNRTSGDEVGLIAPTADGEDWFVMFEHHPVGYVTDDDHTSIDAAAILSGVTEGTEAANEERKEKGMPALHVIGWSEQPHYNAQTHNLEWAIEATEDGTPDHIVNHNVRLLGRDGFMSVTLVADPKDLAAIKPQLETLLGGFTYNPGKRYAEYVSGDRLAGYGLTALVAGGAGAAAAKLGLFAKLGVLLGKAWKLVVIGFIALAGALRRLFQGRRSQGQQPDSQG